MKKTKPSTIIIYILLSVLALFYILPLVWMFLVAFKTNSEVMNDPFGLPGALQWINFKEAWTMGKLGIALINSVVVCGVTLLASMFIGAMAAFVIARMKFKVSNLIFTYFLIGMMLPVHSVLIPLFVQFSDWGLTDNRLGLVLPYVTFSLPMTIFILVNFFKAMPSELFEAACIDGCSIYRVFFKIALPLSKSGLFVTGLMTFVNNWNELLLAMVFISDVKKKTLPVTLTYFVGPYATNYVQMFAAIVIAILPSIIVYCIFSNKIVDGLTQGAVKG